VIKRSLSQRSERVQGSKNRTEELQLISNDVNKHFNHINESPKLNFKNNKDSDLESTLSYSKTNALYKSINDRRNETMNKIASNKSQDNSEKNYEINHQKNNSDKNENHLEILEISDTED